MASIVGWQQTILYESVLPVAQEMMRIFPDGLVIASGLYALITLSYPFAVFFGTMIEATILFRLTQWIGGYVSPIAPLIGSAKMFTQKCRTGFVQPSITMNTLSMFNTGPLGSPFPSAPIFMLATAASYLFTTLNIQSKELQALGPAYSSRYYVSAFFLFMLLFVFCAFRLANGCDSFGILMLTIPIGLLLGIGLVYQNMNLFGNSSINLLGIPLLRNRTASGQQIYVCPK